MLYFKKYFGSLILKFGCYLFELLCPSVVGDWSNSNNFNNLNLKPMKKFFNFTSGLFIGALSTCIFFLLMIFFSTTSFEGIKKAGLLNSIKEFNSEMNSGDVSLPQSLKNEINDFIMNVDPKRNEDILQNYPTTGNKIYWWEVPCDSSLTNKLYHFSPKKLLKKDGVSSHLSIWYDLNDNTIKVQVSLEGSNGEQIFYAYPGDLKGKQRQEFLSRADLKGFKKRNG